MKKNSTSASKVFEMLTATVTRPTSALAILATLLAVSSASAEEKPVTLSDVASAWQAKAQAKAQELKAQAARKAVCKGLEILVKSDSATVTQAIYFNLTCKE